MRLPSWLTWYKKPEYRDIKEYSAAITAGKRTLSPDGRNKSSIPSRLKLEKVLQNKTCSPMSLYDFYMYLKYIEFSPENLEFYIWYQNYERNWIKAAVRERVGEKDDDSVHSSTQSTSSVVKPDKISPCVTVSDFTYDPELAQETVARITDLISSNALSSKCNNCKPRSKGNCRENTCIMPRVSGNADSIAIPLGASDPSLRADLTAVVQTFLLPGSEKELNIPPAMREQALLSLQTSSDPAHLRPIADHVYLLLRNCSHRNFVRLGVSNGTYETICVATGLGIVLTAAGFLCVILRALTPHTGAHSRWDAFAAWPLWWLGVSLVLSGLRGSCFFLLLFSRRQPLPWERFDDGASVLSQRSGVLKALSRLMIFDRKFRVKDIHLRKLQRKIVIQSLAGGAVFASLGVLLFIFLPVWAQTADH
ncbi:Regulator of g protein [Pleurostoma richardsiae]|uniref:Regulator of g protein n=1 Tax=Pleurostoma richardsiae TaxID=41990 RepID=A0AA38R548_9PEZI|nr:Regulator of g protein [Pleurostoma richardsiae]